ncbi:MAG: response regulator transcription factor [Anaerolineales bacterium]|nr:response regulator transcription factor [Anaerolineales bacterium]
MAEARLFIVEEHKGVRCALEERLNRSPMIEVIGHTGEADQAVHAVQQLQPDLVLVEVKRSDGLGLEILRLMSSNKPAPLVVVLTSYPSFWERDAAFRAGACSYLVKSLDSEELIKHLLDLLA